MFRWFRGSQLRFVGIAQEGETVAVTYDKRRCCMTISSRTRQLRKRGIDVRYIESAYFESTRSAPDGFVEGKARNSAMNSADVGRRYVSIDEQRQAGVPGAVARTGIA